MTVGNVIPLPDTIPDSIKSAKVGDVSLSDLQLAGGILMGVNADVAVFNTSFEVVPRIRTAGSKSYKTTLWS